MKGDACRYKGNGVPVQTASVTTCTAATWQQSICMTFQQQPAGSIGHAPVHAGWLGTAVMHLPTQPQPLHAGIHCRLQYDHTAASYFSLSKRHPYWLLMHIAKDMAKDALPSVWRQTSWRCC